MFAIGSKVRTTKGDRLNDEAKAECLVVVRYGGMWRTYQQVICRRPNGKVSAFLEKNLTQF